MGSQIRFLSYKMRRKLFINHYLLERFVRTK